MKCSSAQISKTLTAFAMVLTVVFVGAACSKSGSMFDGARYRVPVTDSEGQVSLQTIELKTFTNPREFSGEAARILVQPTESGGKLSAEKPVGRYVRATDGTIIPADYITLQAVAAYAHQERLREMDLAAGLEDLLNWPLSVGLEVKVLDRGESVENNAIFDGRLDALLIVPYSQGRLPIAFNGGILAHEHFHFIFQKAVLDPLKQTSSHACSAGVAPYHRFEDHIFDAGQQPAGGSTSTPTPQTQNVLEAAGQQIPPDVYNTFVLRGLNEGLADFWGWIYSGDSSFISRSLPFEDLLRRMDSEPYRLRDEKALRESLVDVTRTDKIVREEVRVSRAYSLGTQYARFLKQTVETLKSENGMSDIDAKMTVARSIIASLPAISAQSQRIFNAGYLPPNFILKSLILNLPTLNQKACDAIERFRAPEENFEKLRGCETPEPVPTATPESEAT